NVTFVPGSAGLAPFAFGDLDFDGDFDVADFRNVFLGNMLTNTTGLSPAEAYQAGDFNTDGIADELDFLLYNQAYLTANPGATALSLAATTVPEPSSLLLAGLGILALAGCRRWRGRLLVVGRHVRTCALAATTLLVGASGAQAANLVGWWNLADGMGTTA